MGDAKNDPEDLFGIDPDGPPLTDWELEELTGRPKRSWEADRYRGGGPPFAKIGRYVRYPRRPLLAWLAARVRTSTSDPGPED